MSQLVKKLEELSFRTLPAIEHERYDEWVLRWSDGGSRRGNSVNPVGESSLSLSEKIRYCEQWFARRDAPCTFRLTELADPSLSIELATRGYLCTSPTDVMTQRLATATATDGVHLESLPSDNWLRTVTGNEAQSPEARRLKAQLTSGGGQTHFATIPGPDGVLRAAGMSIDLDGYTSIYNMVTDEGSRRQGLASAILGSLLAAGRESGSTHAVLQVTQENAAAQSLYRKLGFEPVYEYSYMEPSGAG